MSGGPKKSDGKAGSLDPGKRLMQQNIYLYGPPGSGKTTLGRSLAGELGLDFCDLDEEIVSATNLSISQIFDQEGQAGFRLREKTVLQSVSAASGKVVALGGGALLDPECRAMAETSGRILFLEAGWSELVRRMPEINQRPLLDGDRAERLKSLLAERQEHYASFPNRISTDGLSLETSLQEACILLGRFRVGGMGVSYAVYIQPGGIESLGMLLARNGLNGPVVVVTDDHVGGWYAGPVQRSLEGAGYRTQVCMIPSGEEHKTIRTIETMWHAFLSGAVERNSTIVALGGGVVGDMTGFAAATYLRGVAWVAVPTTLLSMVDASLGGKTGIDLDEGKNLVGAFYPPKLVLSDPGVLATLPERELRSGLAEVVKHGIISDPVLLEICREGKFLKDEAAMRDLVARAMAVKIRVIQTDPYEKGVRASLNLGHTLGHAIETVSGYQLKHGEAVAIGMVLAARIAEKMGLASAGLADVIVQILGELGLPVQAPPGLPTEKILQAMRVDKKKQAGSVRFALPVEIGKVVTGVVVNEELILEELE